MGNWEMQRISDLPEAAVSRLWQSHNWAQIFQIQLQYHPNLVADLPLTQP